MTYEKVPANVAAQLTLDEDSLYNQLLTLQSVTENTTAAPIVVRKITAILLEQIIDRVGRNVPNEGRPLPAPYVRLPLEPEVKAGVLKEAGVQIGDGEGPYCRCGRSLFGAEEEVCSLHR